MLGTNDAGEIVDVLLYNSIVGVNPVGSVPGGRIILILFAPVSTEASTGGIMSLNTKDLIAVFDSIELDEFLLSFLQLVNRITHTDTVKIEVNNLIVLNFNRVRFIL